METNCESLGERTVDLLIRESHPWLAAKLQFRASTDQATPPHRRMCGPKYARMRKYYMFFMDIIVSDKELLWFR